MSQRNVNKVIIIGNVGADPELRYTAKGNAVVNLSIATNREIAHADGSKTNQTDWHKAVLWGKRAEICAKYLSKGERIYLEGAMQMKNWTDQEGTVHKSPEILVDDIKFLGKNQKTEQTTLPVNAD